MRNYLEFVLELRDLDIQANTFKVAVLPSPSVGETPAVIVPYEYEQLADALSDLEVELLDEQDLIRLGEQLADRLLPQGSVRFLFQEAVRQAGQDNGVRLRLVIHDTKLAQLPWEFTYLQLHQGEKSRSHFLVLNPQISMVRHEALPEPYPSLSSTTPQKLRLVVTMANPSDSSPLHLDKEKRVIEKALSTFYLDDITLEWQPIIEDATYEDLQRALQSQVDLFHFAGHGIFRIEKSDPEIKGAGSIILLKDKKSKISAPLDAQKLALYLQNAGVRFVVLGACESGRRDGISAWTGIAPAIIERGIPAVVAMQYQIKNKSAIAFSQALYTALASGLSVDEAVAVGRLAMFGKAGVDEVSWGIPVLYMRSVNGVIFPRSADNQSDIAEQFHRVIEQTVRIIEQSGIVIGIKIEKGKASSQPDSLHISITQKADTVSGTMIGYHEKSE